MPKIYYKATRPNGFDFYSGTVDYAGALESGRPLKRKLVDPDYPFECCSSTVYHASDTPSETLIGGKWPCRLFEVTGRPVAREGHKFGFRSLRVIREIEAWKALGPNGREVVGLWNEVSEWSGRQHSAAYDAARSTARAAHVAACDAAYDAARSTARVAAFDTAYYDAAYAVRYATSVLVVRDLITPEQFDVLFAPVVAARAAR